MAVAAGVRPLAGREDHERAARGREDVRAALRARALLEQDELAAAEVLARLGQDGEHLEGEEDVAVEVLVQGVPVARAAAEDQRRRLLLAGGAAALQQLGVLERERGVLAAQQLGPVVGDGGEVAVERAAQRAYGVRERVVEVPV